MIRYHKLSFIILPWSGDTYCEVYGGFKCPGSQVCPYIRMQFGGCSYSFISMACLPSIFLNIENITKTQIRKPTISSNQSVSLSFLCLTLSRNRVQLVNSPSLHCISFLEPRRLVALISFQVTEIPLNPCPYSSCNVTEEPAAKSSWIIEMQTPIKVECQLGSFIVYIQAVQETCLLFQLEL